MTDVLDGVATTLAAGDVFIVKSDRPMTTEHATRLREFVSAALPEGVRVLVMDPGLEFDVLPRVLGVSRVAENTQALLVSFRGMPSDDAIRGLHDMLNGIAPAGLAVKLPDLAAYTKMRAAAIAPFINDLAGMGRIEINREINHASAKIEEEEPWLEALTARLAELDAAAKHPLTYHATEDGDPWAVYREGAHPAESITRQDVIDAIKLYDVTTAEEWAADNAELPAVTVFHLTGIRPETPATKKRRGDDDDAPLDEEGIWFCDEAEPGAYPVTGFKL